MVSGKVVSLTSRGRDKIVSPLYMVFIAHTQEYYLSHVRVCCCLSMEFNRVVPICAHLAIYHSTNFQSYPEPSISSFLLLVSMSDIRLDAQPTCWPWAYADFPGGGEIEIQRGTKPTFTCFPFTNFSI